MSSKDRMSFLVSFSDMFFRVNQYGIEERDWNLKPQFYHFLVT